MRFPAFWQAVYEEMMNDDTAMTCQYPPMTTILRQYSQWHPASLKIVLVDRVDW